MSEPLLARMKSDAWARSVALTWLKALLVLGVICGVNIGVRGVSSISDVFLLRQDAPIAISTIILALLIAMPSVRLPLGVSVWLQGFASKRAAVMVALAALLVGACAFAGWWLVYQTYPLSLDEFWATFDTRVFSRGLIVAPFPVAWRPMAHALEPMWSLQVPGDAAWGSTYLPMNAVFRALFGLVGLPALAGGFWAGLSVVLVYALARDFWPERRDAALVGAILMATSSQLIVLGMSAYAMPPHLALNLGWLWLFRRPGRLAKAAAVLTAFVAMGLHQYIFHPLFAAPFVLQLWWLRRWREAAFHTAAYAIMGLFWILWWPIVFAAQGLPAAAAGAAVAGAGANALAMMFSPLGLNLMAENLLRLMLWQNPLVVPLAMLGVRTAWNDKTGPFLPLAGGALFTILFLTVVTPYQGHGWGYRYLHGFLGSLCLLATLTWVRLTTGAGEPEKARAWACMALSGVVALVLWLPVRLNQVSDFIRPYARSWAAIQQAPADVVLVDPSGLFFGWDLVRNDPFLEQGPKVMNRYGLTDSQVQALCARYRVAYFDRRAGLAAGIARMSGPMPVVMANGFLRSAKPFTLREPACARPILLR